MDEDDRSLLKASKTWTSTFEVAEKVRDNLT